MTARGRQTVLSGALTRRITRSYSCTYGQLIATALAVLMLELVVKRQPLHALRESVIVLICGWAFLLLMGGIVNLQQHRSH